MHQRPYKVRVVEEFGDPVIESSFQRDPGILTGGDLHSAVDPLRVYVPCINDTAVRPLYCHHHRYLANRGKREYARFEPILELTQLDVDNTTVAAEAEAAVPELGFDGVLDGLRDIIVGDDLTHLHPIAVRLVPDVTLGHALVVDFHANHGALRIADRRNPAFGNVLNIDVFLCHRA